MRDELQRQARAVRQQVVRRGRSRFRFGPLDDTTIRLMVGFVLSLGLMVALARAPLPGPSERGGWLRPSEFERIVLTQPRSEREEAEPMQEAMQASAQIDDRQAPSEQTETARREEEPESVPTSEPTDTAQIDHRPERAPALETFELAGNEPDIVGGQRALYLNLRYPEEARREGIEGRVIVEFVVDGEGRVHRAKVIKSVHPALDSAAVEAVRRTTFSPGTHQGREVSVRMHLPIRFELLENK